MKNHISIIPIKTKMSMVKSKLLYPYTVVQYLEIVMATDIRKGVNKPIHNAIYFSYMLKFTICVPP